MSDVEHQKQLLAVRRDRFQAMVQLRKEFGMGSGWPHALSDEACARAIELLLDNKCGGTPFITQALKLEGYINGGVHATTVGRAVKRFARAQGDSLVCLRGMPPKGLTEANKEQRIKFAKANLRRSWDRVLFTDCKTFHFKYPGAVV
jgi:hypothetical protein